LPEGSADQPTTARRVVTFASRSIAGKRYDAGADIQGAIARREKLKSPPSDNEFPTATGLRRLVNACGYSLAGLRHAVQRETAIQQELLACAVLVPLAILLPVPVLERLLLVLSMLLVVVVEFLNSAIEAAIDRISLERHPLSGQAKDLGSAAVAVALLMSAACWVVIAGPVILHW
jgi:diacylglycerol kinase (ATP)